MCSFVKPDLLWISLTLDAWPGFDASDKIIGILDPDIQTGDPSFYKNRIRNTVFEYIPLLTESVAGYTHLRLPGHVLHLAQGGNEPAVRYARLWGQAE